MDDSHEVFAVLNACRRITRQVIHLLAEAKYELEDLAMWLDIETEDNPKFDDDGVSTEGVLGSLIDLVDDALEKTTEEDAELQDCLQTSWPEETRNAVLLWWPRRGSHAEVILRVMRRGARIQVVERREIGTEAAPDPRLAPKPAAEAEAEAPVSEIRCALFVLRALGWPVCKDPGGGAVFALADEYIPMDTFWGPSPTLVLEEQGPG